jgi:ABC-2 type transport system permease protein
MRKILAIVRREFVERVRTKWFWVSALLGPVFFGALIFFPLLFTGGGSSKRIVLVDDTQSSFGARVADSLDSSGVFKVLVRIALRPGVLDSLALEVRGRRLDGFLIVTDATVDSGLAEYRSSNVSSLRDIGTLKDVLGRIVVNTRLERAGVSPEVVHQAQLPLGLETRKISSSTTTTGESSGQSFTLAYAMAILLFMAIAVYGVNVMSSVLEEKTDRVVEVLVSSLRPFQLMVGKVLGVGAVSLFQFAIWGVSAALILRHRTAPGGGVPAAAADRTLFELPHVSVGTLAIFGTYFVGGFLLYSAMFAAVGAMSSSEQEARQAQQPVIFVLMIAYVSIWALSGNPDSAYAMTISFVPFTAPIAMPVRWAASIVPGVQLVGSLALLVVGIVAVSWVASRIYRVGILVTGRRRSLKDLLRWVREA